ncbi:MAG: hypothetical protein KDB84_08985 [Flavobacteriales bacterium]|nr:hypothetical protein [Flavobacteriales bacterium]
MKPLLILWSMALTTAPHDFFVSILTIRHDVVERTLDLTWRITAHDLEHALSDRADLKLGSDREYVKADSLVDRYLREHVTIAQQDRPLAWRWIGKELEGETLYCYLQVEGVPTPNELTISNSLLQDVFPDQQNIVHVEDGSHTTFSHTFIRGAGEHTFTW